MIGIRDVEFQRTRTAPSHGIETKTKRRMQDIHFISVDRRVVQAMIDHVVDIVNTTLFSRFERDLAPLM